MALFQIAAIGSNLKIAGRVQDQVQPYNAVRDCSGSSIREQNFCSTRLSSTIPCRALIVASPLRSVGHKLRPGTAPFQPPGEMVEICHMGRQRGDQEGIRSCPP